MSLLDLIALQRILHNGVELFRRKRINFVGGTVTDDPALDAIHVELGGEGGGGGGDLAGDVVGPAGENAIALLQGIPLNAPTPNDGDVLTYVDPSGWAAAPAGALTRVFGPYHFVNQRVFYDTPPLNTWHFDASLGPTFTIVNSAKLIIELDPFLVHGRTLAEVNVRVKPGTAGGGSARMLAQLLAYDVMTNYSGGAILAGVYSNGTDALQSIPFAPATTLDLTRYSYAVALYASGSAASSADTYYGGNVVMTP
jgi:hypothetical protein